MPQMCSPRTLAIFIGCLRRLLSVNAKKTTNPAMLFCSRLPAKAIPPFFLEHLLASPKLMVESENDTFALAIACLEYHLEKGNLSEAEAEAYCSKILLVLRFHRMPLHFLSCVVALHPRVIASGQLLEIMPSSLAYRVNMPTSLSISPRPRARVDRGVLASLEATPSPSSSVRVTTLEATAGSRTDTAHVHIRRIRV